MNEILHLDFSEEWHLFGLGGQGLPPVAAKEAATTTQGGGRGLNHGLALVPDVTAAKAVFLQDTVLPADRWGEHSERAGQFSTGEERGGAANARPALSASTAPAHLGDVPEVESLVPVLALWLLRCSLSPSNTSPLAILQACKVVGIAATSSVDELLARAIVVVIPGGGFG